MHIGLAIALYGLAAFYALGALNTISKIGRPRPELNTGREAAITVGLVACIIVVLVIAANTALAG